MPITTQAAVYRRLLTHLRGASDITDDSSNAGDRYIYLAASVAKPDDPKAVQLIPGPPSSRHPIAGHGLVHEEFQIAVWRELWMDEADRSDIRVADATYGLLVTASDMRIALIQSLLPTVWDTATGEILTEPIRWMRGTSIAEDTDNPGWAYILDTYRCGYELAWDTNGPIA